FADGAAFVAVVPVAVAASVAPVALAVVPAEVEVFSHALGVANKRLGPAPVAGQVGGWRVGEDRRVENECRGGRGGSSAGEGVVRFLGGDRAVALRTAAGNG